MFPYLRERLWSIHAGIGGNMPEDQLAEVYGGTRAVVIERALPVIAEIISGLEPVLDTTRRAALGLWIRGVYALIALLRNDQIEPVIRRRRW